MIVLDASVILKWLFGEEENRAQAAFYKERHIRNDNFVGFSSSLNLIKSL